jgi:hypothetical protein
MKGLPGLKVDILHQILSFGPLPHQLYRRAIEVLPVRQGSSLNSLVSTFLFKNKVSPAGRDSRPIGEQAAALDLYRTLLVQASPQRQRVAIDVKPISDVTPSALRLHRAVEARSAQSEPAPELKWSASRRAPH